MSLSVLSIPQHILLRELGGVISFDSFGRKKVQRGNLQQNKHSENGLSSLSAGGSEEDRRSDSTEHLQNELSHKPAFPHPRIVLTSYDIPSEYLEIYFPLILVIL